MTLQEESIDLIQHLQNQGIITEDEGLKGEDEL